jgi:uncharacterized SAM-binding protein YcdF (DUF218 family)
MGTAIVVPGSGSVAGDGIYRIGAACLALVREAERLADALPAETVVFSGWAPAGGTPEAEQMLAAWRGADVELVVEPTAAVTAQNASRTLPLLLERGITRAVVVCARLHGRRARFFFSRLYGPAGIDTSYRLVPVGLSASALVWELLALPLCRPQLRVARADVRRSLGA